ncbi:MAG: TVP38/TMEM64 family protein [Firmicutes bacterium]|nr:TVP38/TMEM64 family protein [Bacillota bacterium]
MEGNVNKDKIKKLKICAILVLIVMLLVFVKFMLSARVDSVDEYQEWMKSFGIAAPLFLTVFQAVQVVLPILPGYLGCAAGAISFGTWTGFVCNYIGISAGSIAAYFLAKKYGVDLVISLFSEKQYNKWKAKIANKKSYDVFLFVATLLPMFPDDFLCYFSGLIHMDSKRFIWIIILGKPWCILAYSIIFGLI